MPSQGAILLAGGTGLIGSALATNLAADGWEIRILSRREGPGRFTWNALPEALRNCTAVINLAGEGIANERWTAARKVLLRESRLSATRRIVQALAAEGSPTLLINASAIGIYGARDEALVNESTPHGCGFLPELCSAWETEASQAARWGIRVVTLRTGLVLARQGGLLPQLARSVRWGLGVVPGDGHQGMSWIHIDDVVGLIRLALADPRVKGPLNAVGPNPRSAADFMGALARQLKRPLLPLPSWASRMGITVFTGELGRTLMLEGAFVHPEKALACAYDFRFPTLETALTALLA